MSRSSEYWKKRFLDLEAASNAYGQEAFQKIEPAFDSAQKTIQKEIEAWYGRYAKNNNITMQEARKQLSGKELKEFKWDVKEYIKYGQENALNQQWMKELENASARFHVNRLEALKIRTQHAAEVAFGNELDELDAMARKVFTEDYYHSIFEVQKGFNIGWEVGQIDEKKLNTLIKKPWAADGKNFSDRIWSQKTQLVDELHTQLTRTCILGKAPDDAINAISKKFNTTKNNAGKLVMTEQAYFHSVAQEKAFDDLDVEEFEIVATLDSSTSEICRELDGKHFSMKEYEPGVTAPPFHPWCRTVTVPYFQDNFTGERAARGADGKTYYVPDSMTYKEWKKSLVDGNGEGLKTVKPVAVVKDPTEVFKEKMKVIQDRVKTQKYATEDDIQEAGRLVKERLDLENRNAEAKKRFDEVKSKLEVLTSKVDGYQKEIDALTKGYSFDPWKALMNPDSLGYKNLPSDISEKVKELRKKQDLIKLSDEWKNLMKESVKVNNELTFMGKKSADNLKSVLSEIREMGHSNSNGAIKKSASKVRKYLVDAIDYYPTSWIEKVLPEPLSVKSVNRGYYDKWENLISLSGWDDNDYFETAIHELGHCFEHKISINDVYTSFKKSGLSSYNWRKYYKDYYPEGQTFILDAERSFYKRRTAGEDLKWLGKPYRRDEKSRRDNFINPYMGKDYEGNDFELVSMGFQYAYTDPYKLATDEDMETWIYGILSLY